MPAFYSAALDEHSKAPNAEIVGQLSLSYKEQHQNQKKDLTRSWEATVALVKQFYELGGARINDLGKWTILYEYPPHAAQNVST